MKTRCYNKNTPKYQIYGARGIQVCKAWKESYNAFYDWAMAHGYQTSLTLDRIDPNGNYEPSNCRWASHTEQACNKRNARQIFYQGKLWNLSELSKKTDIPSSTLYEKSEEEIKDLLEKKGKKIQQRLDSISLNDTYYTEEGYLVDHPIVTTCGVFEYKNSDGSIRRELRLPEDVFNEKSLKSYKGKPIIITHDAGEVDKENVRREQIGTIMSQGYPDGENVRCEIIIHDTNALKRCGLKELSLGYSLDTEDISGVYQGESYDCIQRNIEINHLALVGEARAGESARLNIDSKDEEKQVLKGGKVVMDQSNVKGNQASQECALSPEEMEAAIALFKAQQAVNQAAGEGADGEVIEETSAAEEEKNSVEQVRKNMERRELNGKNMEAEEMIAEQKEDLEVLLKEIDRLQAANDMNGDKGELIAKKEEDSEETIDSNNECKEEEEKKKAVNMDSVESIIQDRLEVCRMADKLHLDGVETLPVREGKKRIIRAVNPKMNLDGKSDSYINAAYDIAKQSYCERKSTDDQRQRMIADQVRKDSREESNSYSARKNMISRMTGGKKK